MSKILVLGDKAKPRYHNLQEINPLVHRMQEYHEIVVIEDYPEITKNYLQSFDVIINYIDNWQDRGTEEADQALYNYFVEGGRILSLHNGILVNAAARFLALHGANFQGHADYDLLTYEKTLNSHYITQEMETFSISEEPYEFAFMADRKVKIILQYHLGGKTYPAGWISNQGYGELVYLALGHDERTFRKKPVQELCLRSINWLLR